MNRIARFATTSTMTIAIALGTAGIVSGHFTTMAFAAEDGTGGQGSPQGNQGGQGQGSQGSQSGQDNQGGQGAGQGGPDEGSDSKGPQAGGPADTGSGGGKPVWAQEGIPEVELGRLSVARSPEHVLARALDEAVATMTDPIVDFYNMSLDDIIEEFSLNWDNVTMYDSPLQNLALFQDILEDGDSQLESTSYGNVIDTGTSAYTDPVDGLIQISNDVKLAAVFLGVASDKTITVSEDTVEAMLTILGVSLPSGVSAEDFADMAEAVRLAVYTGHEG